MAKRLLNGDAQGIIDKLATERHLTEPVSRLRELCDAFELESHPTELVYQYMQAIEILMQEAATQLGKAGVDDIKL